MLEFSPTDKQQTPGEEGSSKEATWNPSLVSPTMVPMGSLSPWWFPNFPEVRSPSNNTNGLLAKGVTAFPNAPAYWPTGTYGHSMYAKTAPGYAETISRA